MLKTEKNIIKLINKTIDGYNKFIQENGGKSLGELRKKYKDIEDNIVWEIEHYHAHVNNLYIDFINNNNNHNDKLFEFMLAKFPSYNKILIWDNEREHIYLTDKLFEKFSEKY